MTIPRYTRAQMAAIWSPETRFRIWFEIEAHAADAMAELGMIPKEAAKRIWEKGKNAKFDVARIDEIEREVKHDVVAFLTHLAEPQTTNLPDHLAASAPSQSQPLSASPPRESRMPASRSGPHKTRAEGST